MMLLCLPGCLSACLLKPSGHTFVCMRSASVCVCSKTHLLLRNGCKFVQAVGSMYVFTGGELSLHHLLLDLHVTVSEAGQAQLTVG
jgi:hypothetical protein